MYLIIFLTLAFTTNIFAMSTDLVTEEGKSTGVFIVEIRPLGDSEYIGRNLIVKKSDNSESLLPLAELANLLNDKHILPELKKTTAFTYQDYIRLDEEGKYVYTGPIATTKQRVMGSILPNFADF